MTNPNPFAQHVPAEPAQQQPNPFTQGAAPAAPAPMPAQPNPFAQQQPPAPAAPQAFQQGVANYPAQTAPAQQYAPPAPSYGPPVGQQPMQQQYAPPAPQPVQQQHQAPPQFGPVASAPPPVIGEGRGAQLAHMYGRLVLIFPHKEETVPRRPEHISEDDRRKGNITQQKLTATVVVLDAGPGRMDPIGVDGKPNAFPPEPPTEYAPLPYVRKGMWINQSRLISQARDYLPGATKGGATGGMIAGRVTKAGPQQNDPWYLIGASDAEIGLVQKYLELVQQGVYPHPLAG